MSVKCQGMYQECPKFAQYQIRAKSHEEPIKYVCKTHVSWALSHTAYMGGDIAEVMNIREIVS